MIQGCVRMMPAVRICGPSDTGAVRLHADMTLIMVFTCNTAVWHIKIQFCKEVK
jgi:hypothetical protein